MYLQNSFCLDQPAHSAQADLSQNCFVSSHFLAWLYLLAFDLLLGTDSE